MEARRHCCAENTLSYQVIEPGFCTYFQEQGAVLTKTAPAPFREVICLQISVQKTALLQLAKCQLVPIT